MRAICLMILVGSLGVTTTAKAENSVKFYRWNPGFRAEADASFEWNASNEEFARFLKDPEIAKEAENSSLFAGCYLVQKSEGRNLASTGEKQTPAAYRVCLR